MKEPKIQLECEGCGEVILFPGSAIGTIQECPKCGGWTDVPDLGRVATVYDEQTSTWMRQSALTDRLQSVSNAQQVQWQTQLDRGDKLLNVQEELFRRIEGLVDRWDVLINVMLHASTKSTDHDTKGAGGRK